LRIGAAAGLSSMLMAAYVLFSTTKIDPLTNKKGRRSAHGLDSITNSPNIIQISLAQAAPVIIGLIISILAFSGYGISKLTNTLPPV
jgi:hypothetical protein